MMSKATRKLSLKKELLRTLDEGHLRVVNGGKVYPSYVTECAYDITTWCWSLFNC